MLRRKFIASILCGSFVCKKTFSNLINSQNKKSLYSSIKPEKFADEIKKMSADDKLRLASEVLNTPNISTLATDKYFLAMSAIQSMANEISRDDFIAYTRKNPYNKITEQLSNLYPILRHYENSFDKVLRELNNCAPNDGELYIWHVYNMGYVFKTRDTCFAIDLNHKRAAELEKYLDFLLITHKHQDHFTQELIGAMKASNKAIISNFVDAYGLTKDDSSFDFKDVKIIASKPIAHNKRLLKFVTTFEIVFYKNSEAKLAFLHSGDAHNYKEISTKTNFPHILIPHIRVGLNIPKLCEKIDAQEVLASHILELAHDINKWRWSVYDGFTTCANPNITNCRLPMWGEKITYSY